MLAVAVVGMVDSFFLVLEYIQVLLHPGAPTPCTINTLVSCTKTVQGEWGHVFPGIPNPMMGMLWYSGLVSYATTRWLGATFSVQARRLVGLVITLGLVFSYVLYLASIFDLGGVCPFCLTSTTASTVVALMFALDDATYTQKILGQTGRKVIYTFQLFSGLFFVVGLPVFIAQGLRWIPDKSAVFLHWSFPVMVFLVIFLAVLHVATFRALRKLPL